MEDFKPMSIVEKAEALELHRESLREKARTVSLLPSVNAEDNQLQRALMQMYRANQVVYYPNNNDTFIEKGYCYNPHVYTVISWKGRNISQVPFNLFKVTDKKAHKHYLHLKDLGKIAESNVFKQKAMEEVETGGLAELLKRPNQDQSISDFLVELCGYMNLTGNLYTYGMVPSGFDVFGNLFSALYIAPSQLMQIISGGIAQPISKYKVCYSYDTFLEIEADKICHLKNWNPKTDIVTGKSLYGLSPLEPLLRTLKTSNESEDAHLGYMVNGSPAGVLSNDSDYAMSQEDRDKAQKLFDQRYGGGRNVNRIIQATSKVSWQQIGLPVADLMLLEADKASQRKINNVYGIPDIIFSNENSTYNNLITAEKDAWQNVLIPDLRKIRDGLFNRFVVPAWSKKDGVDYYVDFDTSEIPCLQTDLKEQTERMMLEAGFGVWTPNDILKALGKEESKDPYMNDRFMDNKYHKLGEAPSNPNFSQNNGKQ